MVRKLHLVQHSIGVFQCCPFYHGCHARSTATFHSFLSSAVCIHNDLNADVSALQRSVYLKKLPCVCVRFSINRAFLHLSSTIIGFAIARCLMRLLHDIIYSALENANMRTHLMKGRLA